MAHVRVEATAITFSGYHELSAKTHRGRWWINGDERPDLDGCVDIDFESSLVTNTLAVHCVDPTAMVPVEVPAVFVRADNLRVERIEQTYLRFDEDTSSTVFDYTSTTFDYKGRLVFDTSGLVLDYPGIGRRYS